MLIISYTPETDTLVVKKDEDSLPWAYQPHTYSNDPQEALKIIASIVDGVDLPPPQFDCNNVEIPMNRVEL